MQTLNGYSWNHSDELETWLPVEPPPAMDTNEQGEEAPVSKEILSIAIFRENI